MQTLIERYQEKLDFILVLSLFTMLLMQVCLACMSEQKLNTEIIDINEVVVTSYVAPPSIESEPEPAEFVLPEPEAPSEEEIVLSKMLYGEARGCSKMEQAAVIWCALNRVDMENAFRDTIVEVVLSENQFEGYLSHHPVRAEQLAIVRDVLSRWEREKNEEKDVGRVLPKEYVFFYGDGEENHFYTKDNQYWDWSLPDPYA